MAYEVFSDVIPRLQNGVANWHMAYEVFSGGHFATSKWRRQMAYMAYEVILRGDWGYLKMASPKWRMAYEVFSTTPFGDVISGLSAKRPRRSYAILDVRMTSRNDLQNCV